MRSGRYLMVPAVATGGLVAAYLLVRPYGDSDPGAAMAIAFASPWWVVAHMCGALGLAAFAWLSLRLADVNPSGAARWARGGGLVGTALVLPYFGAESFGLHALGAAALGGDGHVLTLVDQVRYQPLAVTMFGVGLVALGVSGVSFALAWARLGGVSRRRWTAWPLGALMALFLPQFFLPEWARMVFGVVFLGAACLVAASCPNAAPRRDPSARVPPVAGRSLPRRQQRQPERRRSTNLVDGPGGPGR